MAQTAVLQQASHLAAAIRVACPRLPAMSEESAADYAALLTDPVRLRARLEQHLAGECGRIRVTGTLDRRLTLIERLDEAWVAADLSGRPHDTRTWPTWAHGHITIENPESPVSLAFLDETAVYRLSRPNMLLAALYHPEFFPLPRFPLGISDVARAARSTLLGTTGLRDMQLGVTLDDLIAHIRDGAVDILGISVTFGQHDLMAELLDATYALDEPPMVVAGGSLTARNERMLLDQYPGLLIARGAGESTIRGVLAHWHGDIAREEIPGIGYMGAPRGAGTMAIRRRTARPVTADLGEADILPELDLLDATLTHNGVAQAEGSRGCTNTCSFCPRGHKGMWAGAGPDGFHDFLAEVSQVFDRHPETPRVMYMVDEEFIGRGPEAVPRALAMADALHDAGFRWETSCRVDQVVSPGQDMQWHVERAQMWRSLIERGLRRCLFGVESGVDSILDRFHKETTAEQNALAVRTLSALGVPTRFTYITFDHLMTFEELRASYLYQGRTDLVLRPLDHLPVEVIVAGVGDPEFVAKFTTGKPFHQAISYMLVSMECLIGAPYTRLVQAEGLAGQQRPSMGRQDAEFKDWRIGIASAWAQLWIDRSFPLDYTLKSIEKVTDGDGWRAARRARVVLKESAYSVLGEMLREIQQTPLEGGRDNGAALHTAMRLSLERELAALRDQLDVVVRKTAELVPDHLREVLVSQYLEWRKTETWRLINAGDPCGT